MPCKHDFKRAWHNCTSSEHSDHKLRGVIQLLGPPDSQSEFYTREGTPFLMEVIISHTVTDELIGSEEASLCIAVIVRVERDDERLSFRHE